MPDVIFQQIDTVLQQREINKRPERIVLLFEKEGFAVSGKVAIFML